MINACCFDCTGFSRSFARPCSAGIAETGRQVACELILHSLCEDYRMQICGGMVGAINLFEACIVPRLLANSGVWTDISSSVIKKLDATPNLFLQALLRLPSSTVLPSYRAETGLLGMKWRVWESKLLLAAAIMEQEGDVLAGREKYDKRKHWCVQVCQNNKDGGGLSISALETLKPVFVRDGGEEVEALTVIIHS